MTRLTQLIALTLTRDQLLTILTQNGYTKIFIERHTTNTLRREAMDLILAASDDDTND